MCDRGCDRGRDRGAARAVCGLLFALACIFSSANVGAAPVSVSGEQVTLIAAENAPGAKTFLAGLRMEMKDGWHTYWRMPGDSGIAPSFDWSGSENVAAVELLWPAPQRFDTKGDNTIGYTHEVVWPVLVRAADPAKPVTLKLAAFYGVCANICVPGETHLTLRLPNAAPGAGTPIDGALIRRYLARVPVPPADPKSVSVKFSGGAKPHLDVRLTAARDTPALIVEGPAGVWFGEPAAARDGAALVYTVPVELDPGKTLKGADVTLTFAGPATAIEVKRRLG
ncbi:MAG TPA: protein-disulfide reductase DsbD domain-containing protein [Parvibaculum sp.]